MQRNGAGDLPPLLPRFLPLLVYRSSHSHTLLSVAHLGQLHTSSFYVNHSFSFLLPLYTRSPHFYRGPLSKLQSSIRANRSIRNLLETDHYTRRTLTARGHPSSGSTLSRIFVFHPVFRVGSNGPYVNFVKSFLGLIPYLSLPCHRLFESTCFSDDPYDPEP
jgi:hypothetical protein